jgi:hypothetical protein
MLLQQGLRCRPECLDEIMRHQQQYLLLRRRQTPPCIYAAEMELLRMMK